MNEIKRSIIPLIFTIVLLMIFLNIGYVKGDTSAKDASLVIYGDNIKTNYEPFVENNGIYLSVDTICKGRCHYEQSEQQPEQKPEQL